jgi:fibronectin type 3 domain-containing protein
VPRTQSIGHGRLPAAVLLLACLTAPVVSAEAPGLAKHEPARVSLAASEVVTDCSARPTTRVRGTIPGAFVVSEPTDARTYDLRGARSIGMPFDTTEPFVMGTKLQQQARNLCVLGGEALGSPLVKDMPRPYVKQKYAGHAMYVEGVEGHTYVVDGVRIDQAEDGFMPLGDGFVLRNAYISNARDDCVENDVLSGGLVEDTLFDGCYMGISVDPGGLLHPGPTEDDKPVVLDRILMRLKPLPDPVAPRAPDGLEHNRIWKLAQNIPPVIVRDSVFLVEERGAANNQPFPADFTAENVTLVWLGDGPYPFQVPPGVTVATDPEIWEQARENWLARHGYPLTPDYPGLGRLPVTGDGLVELSWRLGSGADSYRIMRGVNSGGPYETIGEVGADSPRSFLDTTVENGQRYYYVVVSVNSHGESQRSNEAGAMPVAGGATVPPAPQDLVATPDETTYNHGHHSSVSGRIVLGWNHVAGAEEYVLRRGPSPGQYNFETVVRENSFLDVGRPVGVPIYYQVVARNRTGLGAPSAEVSATPPEVEQGLSRPRFRPAVAGDGEIRLSWLSDPLSPGTRYTIMRAVQPGGPYEVVTELVDEVEYTDTGLTNGTTYYYRVRQQDANGISEFSQEIPETPQATPVVPATPSQLTAKKKDNSVVLHWQPAHLATHYTVSRATSPHGPYEPLYRLVRGTTYADNALRSHSRYYYRVSAWNSFGQSAASSTRSAAVGKLDHSPPSVSVGGVRDGASYVLGAVPAPRFWAHDGSGLDWKKAELLTPGTQSGAGHYTYLVKARDRFGNDTIIYTTYQVRYRFDGFHGDLGEPGRTLDPDEPIEVTFGLTDARGAGKKATFTVLVDGRAAPQWPAAAGGSGGHRFLLDARQLSEELHTLTVVLDDDSIHQTTFRLARG